MTVGHSSSAAATAACVSQESTNEGLASCSVCVMVLCHAVGRWQFKSNTFFKVEKRPLIPHHLTAPWLTSLAAADACAPHDRHGLDTGPRLN